MVPAAPPLGNQGTEHLVHERRDRKRSPVLPARRKRYTEVLAVVFDLAPGGEVARKEFLALDMKNLASGEPPGEDLYYPLGSYPGIDGRLLGGN